MVTVDNRCNVFIVVVKTVIDVVVGSLCPSSTQQNLTLSPLLPQLGKSRSERDLYEQGRNTSDSRQRKRLVSNCGYKIGSLAVRALFSCLLTIRTPRFIASATTNSGTTVHVNNITITGSNSNSTQAIICQSISIRYGASYIGHISLRQVVTMQ